MVFSAVPKPYNLLVVAFRREQQAVADEAELRHLAATPAGAS